MPGKGVGAFLLFSFCWVFRRPLIPYRDYVLFIFYFFLGGGVMGYDWFFSLFKGCDRGFLRCV